MAENEQIAQELTDGIAMLEQILEVMPDDQESLRALYNAYCQAQRRDRAIEYLGKLADVILAKQDFENLDFIVHELHSYTEDFPGETVSRLARLQAMSTQRKEETPHSESTEGEENSSRGENDISEELTMAWGLYEEGQLSQEEYSMILHDLTEISSKELETPPSVLHVLFDRGFGHINKLLNHMSSRTGTPCISLRNFEISQQVASTIPLQISALEGAIPFDFFGEDLLVAILNPYNKALKGKIEQQTGRRCHTYLVHPEDYDTALGKIRDLQK